MSVHDLTEAELLPLQQHLDSLSTGWERCDSPKRLRWKHPSELIVDVRAVSEKSGLISGAMTLPNSGLHEIAFHVGTVGWEDVVHCVVYAAAIKAGMGDSVRTPVNWEPFLSRLNATDTIHATVLTWNAWTAYFPWNILEKTEKTAWMIHHPECPPNVLIRVAGSNELRDAMFAMERLSPEQISETRFNRADVFVAAYNKYPEAFTEEGLLYSTLRSWESAQRIVRERSTTWRVLHSTVIRWSNDVNVVHDVLNHPNVTSKEVREFVHQVQWSLQLDVIAHPKCPVDIVSDFAFSKHADQRNAALSNPNCPTRIKVLAATVRS